ncbi:MAG: hypothetical protein RLZZ580_857, partial [Cyanobacteriota bacterium]
MHSCTHAKGGINRVCGKKFFGGGRVWG